MIPFCRHLVRTISGHTDWVRWVEPSDDGRLIASCSNDQVSAYIDLRSSLVHAYCQTARIIDPTTGETKVELRGHEHTIEVVAFAPVAAYTAIRELAGIPVRFVVGYRRRRIDTLRRRARSGRSVQAHMWRRGPATSIFAYGTPRADRCSATL